MAKRLTTQDFIIKIDNKHGKGEFTVLGEYVNGKLQFLLGIIVFCRS